ncbi:MAG: hypothetical protein JNM62_12430 [Flavobacteriales bacterium]|nr:hypothetical protein [Flavobacteriales bacterium]
MSARNRRTILIIGIVLILVCCTVSAIFGLRAGHTARAASTFFAGVAFSALFFSLLPPRK